MIETTAEIPAEAPAASASERAVSIIIRRVVRAGRQAEFEAAVRAFSPVSLTFPGHLGVHVVPPPAGGREYVVILSFASERAWREFLQWDRYRSWAQAVRPLLDDDPAIEEVTGLETWFRMPGEHVVVPRWKMAVVTWVGVCLSVGLLNAVLRPWIADWPWWANLLGFNAVVVASLTWVVMPLLSRSARVWLRRPTLKEV
ncbi:MAG: antibiotic biosynthesis monooxygenase [Paludisphaera borealis]|uniref:antibiotic biosynthesis monooxygenase n=1 Tax=Paludisphaera borealis TaxID=1387353 RepID=UPI002849DF91|nr:antibiotic biosynthesis monooxygenase [Paludisphaera borealis]MDR3618252.1 antibiotic biosynthesis monooxygenase [Paludisphaera borealis]